MSALPAIGIDSTSPLVGIEAHRSLRGPKSRVSILDVFDALPWFRDRESWLAWRAFLAAVYALPMTDAELAIYRACTGRKDPPPAEVSEVACIVGRRGGKSFIDSTIMGYEACYRDYTPYLAPGERVYFPIVAADKKGARACANYIKAFLNRTAYAGLVDETVLEKPATEQTILHFREDPITIEVFTGSFRTTRGYTIPVFLGDEIAFWRTGESDANPDREILKAVRPGMATIPRSKLLMLSSPYGEAGALYDTFANYYGEKNEARAQEHGVLVWKAPTERMNPTPEVRAFVALERKKDPTGADAEYGANFRKDQASYVARAVLEACTDAGVFERAPYSLEDTLPAERRYNYHAFVDPSGGSQDSFTLSIAHWDTVRGRAVQDLVVEWTAPFSPRKVVSECSALVKRFRLRSVTGDAYAGEWPRDRFAENGLSYVTSEKTKHEIYKDLMPGLNQGAILLLEHQRQKDQFLGLRRRVTPLGKDVIDHAEGEHDDVANAAAGACLLAYDAGQWMAPPKPYELPAQTTTEIMNREMDEMIHDAEVERERDTGDIDVWADA